MNDETRINKALNDIGEDACRRLAQISLGADSFQTFLDAKSATFRELLLRAGAIFMPSFSMGTATCRLTPFGYRLHKAAIEVVAIMDSAKRGHEAMAKVEALPRGPALTGLWFDEVSQTKPPEPEQVARAFADALAPHVPDSVGMEVEGDSIVFTAKEAPKRSRIQTDMKPDPELNRLLSEARYTAGDIERAKAAELPLPAEPERVEFTGESPSIKVGTGSRSSLGVMQIVRHESGPVLSREGVYEYDDKQAPLRANHASVDDQGKVTASVAVPKPIDDDPTGKAAEVCPDCKGTRQYVGLAFDVRPCPTCCGED